MELTQRGRGGSNKDKSVSRRRLNSITFQQGKSWKSPNIPFLLSSPHSWHPHRSTQRSFPGDHQLPFVSAPTRNHKAPIAPFFWSNTAGIHLQCEDKVVIFHRRLPIIHLHAGPGISILRRFSQGNRGGEKHACKFSPAILKWPDLIFPVLGLSCARANTCQILFLGQPSFN